ncbi:MAG: hypothetical protein R3350_01605, partial [Saprospiraceae bacterium]|nr:hypothetical protein [Saprospiraceae bacterium]
MRQLTILSALILYPAFFLFSQVPAEALDKMAETYALASLDQFYQLLSMPNDAHFAEDLEMNIKWCERAFENRGFSMRRLSTPTVPLLLAERRTT